MGAPREGAASRTAGDASDRFGKELSASGSVELRNIAELGPASREHFLPGQSLEFVQVPQKLFVEHGRRACGIAVSACERLGHNIVDAADSLHIFGGNLERFSSL